MHIDAEHVLCRFHLSSRVHYGATPLYERIVRTARGEGLRGATVLEGFYGLRPDGTLLEARGWAIEQALPMVVEVVDDAARIERLLGLIEPMFAEGVITLERAHVLTYRTGPSHENAETDRPNVLGTRVDSRAPGVRTMKMPENGVLLRIFIGESDRDPAGDRPLFEAIVRRARDARLAGATVLRGTMGFGRHSLVHTSKLLDLSTDLPIVIEIVDAEDRIDAFLPIVDELVTEGLVTREVVRIVRYVSPETP